MQSQFTLIQNDQWWTIPLAWTIAPQSLNILNQRCTNTRTNDYSSRLHFFEYCFHVSHNIVEYTRSEESRAPRCNKFLSYPIHLSRSHRVASHSLAHLSHNRSAAAVTNPSAAQADGLFVRSVCLISSLVPCSSTRNVTAAVAAATAAPCIDRGRCSSVERNNVNQTRVQEGKRGAGGDRSLRLGLRNHPTVTLNLPVGVHAPGFYIWCNCCCVTPRISFIFNFSFVSKRFLFVQASIHLNRFKAIFPQRKYWVKIYSTIRKFEEERERERGS